MARKPKKTEKPQVSQELNGFNVEINEFGEIVSSYDIHKLNTFLDKNVDDKKFRGVDVVKRDPQPQDESDGSTTQSLPKTMEEDER